MKRIKSILAFFLAITMMFSISMPASTVWASEDYSDYVPGEMPTDLITNNWPYADATGSVEFGWSNAWGSETQWAAITDVACTATSYYGAMGTFIKQDKINETLEPGVSYVFSAKIKNAGAAGTNPKFGIWFWKTEKIDENTTNHYKSFPAEYGASGYAPGSEFEDYNVTITVPEEGASNLGIGMVTATNGDILQLDWSEGIYFAKEQKYDITNEVVGSSKVFAGSSATLDAKVVNQVGRAGTLDQTIEFIALDAERTASVEGFTFTANADGTTNVEVADTVVPGTYVILAQSTIYDGFRKGATIEVVAEDTFTDNTIGEIPANILARGSSGYIAGNTNGGGCTHGWYNGYGSELKWEATQDISLENEVNLGSHNVSGALIASKYVNGGSPLSANTSYVFSAKIRNAGTNETGAAFQFYYQGNVSKGFSVEHGKAGYVPGTEFEDYKITFNTGESTSGTLLYGLVTAKAGDLVLMSTKSAETAYLAEETAYELKATATGDTTLFSGNSTTIKAEVLNQIGLKGTLGQNFDYAVLNEDRTAFADGITVVPGDDGVAAVTVDEDAQSGKYVVLVASRDNPQLRKGISITVIGTGYFEDHVKGEMPANLLARGSSGFIAGNTNGGGCTHGWYNGYGSELKWEAAQDISLENEVNHGSHNVSGALIASKYVNGGSPLSANTSYVFSAKIRNAGTNETGAAFQLYYQGNVSKGFSVEHGKAGYVPGTEFEDYKITFNTGESTSGTLLYGLVTAKAGDIVLMSTKSAETAYLAEEEAHDISVEAEKTNLLPGETTTFTAEVANQVGLPGTLTQEFDWYALNASRTAFADGITVNEADGVATVEVADSVVPGTYVIYAKHASGIGKGVEIKVTSGEPQVESTEIIVNENTASFYASLEGAACDSVKFVIASYTATTKKLVDVDAVDVAVADGAAEITAENAPVISIAGADIVRLFVWDGATLAPFDFAPSAENIKNLD